MIQSINYEYPSDEIVSFTRYGDSLKMVSKYFQFSKKYLKTPYLSSLKIITKSDIPDSYFDIIIYTSNQLGIPTFVLNNDIIRCYTENGINENIIDIRNHQIQFPKQGFFIVINWKNTESNTSNFIYHRGNKDVKFKGSIVQPMIGTYPSILSDTFLLIEKGWMEAQKRESIFEDYKNKYHNLAISLKLSV
ncbi:MAG: hypothetical protein ABR595_06795 [Psychroflexus sp.]